MRKLGIVFIIAGVLLGIYSLSVDNIFTNVFAWNASDKIEISKDVSSEAIQKIEIAASSANVRVVQGSSGKVKAKLQGKVNTKYAEDIDLVLEPRSDTLYVEVDLPHEWERGLQLGAWHLQLTVELPEKNWNSLVVATKSGNIQAKEIMGETVKLGVHSGNVTGQQIKAKQLSIDASSGNVKIDGFQSDKLDFNVRSGNVDLLNGQAEIRGETQSGNIRLQLKEMLYPADLTARSGNVTVALDKAPQSVAVDYRGNSGSGKIKWDGFVTEESNEDQSFVRGQFGQGEVELKVRTGSGGFKLE